MEGTSMFESMSFAMLVAGAVLLLLFLRSIVRIVPQNEAYVVERLGKYNRTLLAGFHITIPILERVAYKHSLKEFAVDVASQQAITRDNVPLSIDGVLYMKIMDPRSASYGVDNLQFAITQLAQTSMRAEIGKLTLDDTFESRENINARVTNAIDEASETWGTKVLRYEVKDISPPATILEEMEKQMGAERERRVAVTTSEGYRQAQINQAEGDREAQILRAQGIAESMTIEATARAEAIRKISEAINADGGTAAVAQQLAEQYVDAFDKLAREGTIALIPSDGGDISGMVAKAFTAYDQLKGTVDKSAGSTATSTGGV
jgi:regulator of protease activity HflC (stomatin/prohibitin superfamily)